MSTHVSFAPRFEVIAGPMTGMVFDIPAGVSTIGRGSDVHLHLADPDASRRHATLRSDLGRVMLSDLGSTNGTAVNGWPLTAPQELLPGDVVQIGRSELRYGIAAAPPPRPHQPLPAHPGAPATSKAPVGRVRIGRVILLAAVVQVLGLLVTAGFTFVAGRAVGLPAWLIAPAAAVTAGIAQALFEAFTGPSEAEAEPARRRSGGRRGVPAVAALLVLVLLGTGGYGTAVGIRYAVGWVTGNEDQIGQERLVSSPGPSGSGDVKVTVTSVVNTAHFTRVTLTVVNAEQQSATLSLFHNCVLTGGGVTLAAEPFKSGWTEEVPPDSSQQGHITFPGHLPDGAVTAQLSFVHVFVFGRPGVNDALVVKPIQLRAP